MYEFRDVNEVLEGTDYPSEALLLNGEYIEDLVPGYRTLNVSGREALSPELDYFETGARDGSVLRRKRYPARTITVKYQIIASSNEEFRESYNQLGKVLNVKNAQLIFNDETDKYFTGTPIELTTPEPGRNAVTGSIKFFCADPFKYSVVEYEATPDFSEKCIFVDYNGTYKSFPRLEADFFSESEASEDGETVTELTGNGECGYVAFFNENEKIIQIGDPEETDGENAYAKSQTLVNSVFNASTSWGTAAKSQWKVNSGITFSDAVVQDGNVAMGVASYTTPEAPKTTTGTLLTATSKKSKPYINYKITAKASGRTSNSVKLNISVTTALDKDSNYFGKGYALTGYLYINSAWKSFKIKDTSEYWEGKTGHTVNLSYTITGLSASTTSIIDLKFKTSRPDGLGEAGLMSETACKSLTISKYETPQPESYYLAPSDFGSGSKWHGASITRVLPADASGETGAKNFTLTYCQKMSIGENSSDSNQLGGFLCLLVNGSGTSRKIVGGVQIYKGSSGKNANLRFYMNGAVAETITVDLSYNNKNFNSSKSSSIVKSGETVTFNICGIKKVYKDSDLSDVAVNEITFMMTKYASKTPLTYNGLYWAKFVKNNCETWKDIPNKFSTGDVVEADCSDGKIYLNGVHTPSLGALGNDWEGFYLTPGLNQIGFSYSEWVADDYAPSFKLKYREVYI